MEKGYFFSLEALIAALILMSSIVLVSSGISAESDKEAKIYRAMSLLEEKGVLGSMSNPELKSSLTGTLGFDVEVNPSSINGPFIKYLIADESSEFKTIRIAYQQP